jgi:RNA polymerase sigma factor (sigma-70 family)
MEPEGARTLYDGNIRLTRRYVAQIPTDPETRRDLEQVAKQALWEAAVAHDPAKGYQFSTLACLYIRGRLQQYQRDCMNMIRVPRLKYKAGVRQPCTLESELPPGAFDVEANPEDSGLRRVVGEAIRDLAISERDRRVLRLTLIEERTYAEAGRAVNRSHSLAHRIIKAHRPALQAALERVVAI